MIKVDFTYSSHKDYATLLPLFEYVKKRGWQSRLFHIHKMKCRNRSTLNKLASTIIIAYDGPLNRLRKCGWNGDFIYLEHGLSPVKSYTYLYRFFFEASLLFFPGEVFQRKMLALAPSFTRGLLGGYTKCDQLVKESFCKEHFIRKYNLNPDKPIILFAPSWGSKQGAGIRNIKHLKDLDNVISVPHPSEYRIARRYKAVIPPLKSNINEFIHCADLIVSDISSIVAEAAIIGKPTVQLRLEQYPGCFPSPEKRKTGIWVSDNVIEKEMQTNRLHRPFKIPYIDEDWDFGYSAEPPDIQNTIQQALDEPNRYKENRTYWAGQSCWHPDGNCIKRIADMTAHFLTTGEIKQMQ